MLRGMFAAIRNPTAHEPKTGEWRLTEQDALDALTFISMLHWKLDACTLTVPVAPPSVS